MPSPYDQLIELRDFTPGLRLGISPYNLEPGETDQAQDVEFQLDGAVALRPTLRVAVARSGTVPWANATYSHPDLLHTHTYAMLSSPNEESTAGGVMHRLVAVMRPQTRAPNTRARLVVSAPVVNTNGNLSVASVTETILPGVTGATEYRPVSVASVGSNLYICQGDGKVIRRRFNTNGTHVDTTLEDPNESRTYWRLRLDDMGNRVNLTTETSWSEEYSNPFADIHLDEGRGRFPTSDFIYAVNSGLSEFMFSVKNSTVRWSHPLAWVDSGYFGFPVGEQTNDEFTGDPGPDWPHSNTFPLFQEGKHVSGPDATLRLMGPEDWSRHDFVDVAPSDGDRIVALQHYVDTLLVFKRNSLWGLVGSLPNLELIRFAAATGTISPKSVVATPAGVFFYSHPEGLMLWTPDGQVVNVSDKLEGFDGRFDGDSQTLSRVALGYHNRRLFLTVPWRHRRTARETTTFMLDLRHGGWTEWNLDVGAYAELASSSLGTEQIMVTDGIRGHSGGVLKFGTNTDGTDTMNDAGATAFTNTLDPSFRVGPVAADPPDTKARWRRSRIEFTSTKASNIHVDVDVEIEGTRDHRKNFNATPGVHLEPMKLAQRGRYSAILLKWRDPLAKLVSALFVWWPGRRTPAVTSDSR